MKTYNADPTDSASDLETEQREALIRAKQEAYAAMKPPIDFDGKHCVQCDDEIPTGRLALNKWTCVICQKLIDRKGARK